MSLSKTDIEIMLNDHLEAQRNIGNPYGNYGVSQIRHALQQPAHAPSKDLLNMADVLRRFTPEIERGHRDAQGLFNVAIAQVMIHNKPVKAVEESHRLFDQARRDSDHWMRREDVITV